MTPVSFQPRVAVSLDNDTDRNLDDAEFVIPLFALGQGTFAALASRLLGRARSE